MSLVSYYNTGLGMGEFGIIFNNAKVQNIFGTWLINISFVCLVFSHAYVFFVLLVYR